MSGMKLLRVTVGAIATNSYILSNETTGEGILIDPGARADRLLEKIKSQNIELKAILLTHGHFDHIMAVKEIVDELHVKTYIYKEEKELVSSEDLNCSKMFGYHASIIPDVLFDDQEVLTIAGIPIRVIHTPGHTRGSVCFYIEDESVLISGDTLFRESIGRTDLPTGSSEELIDSVRNKLYLLPDEVRVYPGHGIDTTIGYEKEHNQCV